MKTKSILYLAILLLGISGCKSYTSNVILKAEPTDINWQSAYTKVTIEYPIKVGDKIQFSLFTNAGESIIDPAGNLVTVSSNFGDENKATQEKPTFEVLENGMCFFPVIGKIQVTGLKTSQLDSLLSSQFEAYYNGVYVISKVVNKKIIILGGLSGGRIVPFTSNMSLLEAIAVYGGLNDQSRGYNIRVIRGDLKNPEITVVNLRTVSDMKSSIVTLKPDDIIYIEPVRRPGVESLRDNMYILNIFQAMLTTVVLINTLLVQGQ
jgi:polysaccharide export outer membrane protein